MMDSLGDVCYYRNRAAVQPSPSPVARGQSHRVALRFAFRREPAAIASRPSSHLLSRSRTMGRDKRERRIVRWIDTLNDSTLVAERLTRDTWDDRTGRWVDCAALVRVGDVSISTSFRVNGTVNSTFARGLHHYRGNLRRSDSLDRLIARICFMPDPQRDDPIRLSRIPTIDWVSKSTAFVAPGWFGERRITDAYLGGIYANVRSRTLKRKERRILRRRLNELWGDRTERDVERMQLYLTWHRDRGFAMRDPGTSESAMLRMSNCSAIQKDYWYHAHDPPFGHNSPRVPGIQRGRKRRYARRRALLNADSYDVFGLTELFAAL